MKRCLNSLIFYLNCSNHIIIRNFCLSQSTIANSEDHVRPDNEEFGILSEEDLFFHFSGHLFENANSVCNIDVRAVCAFPADFFVRTI